MVAFDPQLYLEGMWIEDNFIEFFSHGLFRIRIKIKISDIKIISYYRVFIIIIGNGKK